jgi:hypothetical protein
MVRTLWGEQVVIELRGLCTNMNAKGIGEVVLQIQLFPLPHCAVLRKVDDFVISKWSPGENKNPEDLFPTAVLLTITYGISSLISGSYSFISGLFDNIVSNSECIAYNGRMISEWSVGKEMEGSGRGLCQGIIPNRASPEYKQEVFRHSPAWSRIKIITATNNNNVTCTLWLASEATREVT